MEKSSNSVEVLIWTKKQMESLSKVTAASSLAGDAQTATTRNSLKALLTLTSLISLEIKTSGSTTS